jgi:hypothetical protein
MPKRKIRLKQFEYMGEIFVEEINDASMLFH